MKIIVEIRTRFKQIRNVPSAQLWKLMQRYLEEPANALYLQHPQFDLQIVWPSMFFILGKFRNTYRCYMLNYLNDNRTWAVYYYYSFFFFFLTEHKC